MLQRWRGRIGNDDTPPVVACGVDGYGERAREWSPEAVGPLDCEHALLADIGQPQVGGFILCEAIQVGVIQRQCGGSPYCWTSVKVGLLTSSADAPRP